MRGNTVGRRAAIYCRLSKDQEGQTSTDRQEAECRQWADRHDLEVCEVFTDLLSGFRRIARPAFEAAVSGLEAGDFDTLIVWKLDRLSRRGMGQVGLVLDRLEETGGRIVSVMDGIDTSHTQGRILVAILSEMARGESANNAARVSSALAAKTKAGHWLGRPPWGYAVNEAGTLDLDPTTEPIIRSVIDRVVGGASLFEVAADLQQQGVPTPRGGRTWSAGVLRDFLRNPVLAGWRSERNNEARRSARQDHPARDPRTGEPFIVAPAILTPAERRRLLEVLDSRSRVGKNGRRRGTGRRPRGLLTGFLRWDMCGSGFVFNSGSGQRAASYHCRGMNEKRCVGTTVQALGAHDYVAGAVLMRLAALEPGDPLLDAVARRWVAQHSPETERERRELEAALAEISAQLDDLAEARYLRPEFAGPDGHARYDRLATALAGQAAAARCTRPSGW